MLCSQLIWILGCLELFIFCKPMYCHEQQQVATERSASTTEQKAPRNETSVLEIWIKQGDTSRIETFGQSTVQSLLNCLCDLQAKKCNIGIGCFEKENVTSPEKKLNYFSDKYLCKLNAESDTIFCERVRTNADLPGCRGENDTRCKLVLKFLCKGFPNESVKVYWSVNETVSIKSSSNDIHVYEPKAPKEKDSENQCPKKWVKWLLVAMLAMLMPVNVSQIYKWLRKGLARLTNRSGKYQVNPPTQRNVPDLYSDTSMCNLKAFRQIVGEQTDRRSLECQAKSLVQK